MLAIAFLGCLKLSLSLPSHLRLWWWMVRVGEEQDRFVQYSCRPPNPARCNATALPTQSQHSSINPARKSILPPKSRISITLAQQQTERKREPFSFQKQRTLDRISAMTPGFMRGLPGKASLLSQQFGPTERAGRVDTGRNLDDERYLTSPLFRGDGIG